MASRVVPAGERVQVVTREMLENLPLTIKAEEGGPDLRIYGSKDDTTRGYPLRADDEVCLQEGFDVEALGTDGLWMETETATESTVYVLKGMCLVRNPRRETDSSVSGTIDLTQVGGESQSAVDVAAVLDALEDALATVGGDNLLVDAAATLPTEQQSPVGVEDSQGAQVDPVDAADLGPYSDRVTATGTYATISPGTYGDEAVVVVDANGAGTLSVEVSVDGGTNWDVYTVDYDIAGTIERVPGYADVRAQADANLNALTVSAKGV